MSGVLTYVGAALVIGLVPGWIAYRRNHSFIQWWIFGALLWPVALALALTLPRHLCPHCRGRVNPGATVCARCGRDVAEVSDPRSSVSP